MGGGGGKLWWGYRLTRLYPRIAALSCRDCVVNWYDADGKPVERGGKLLPRPAGSRPPCRTCPKIPPGTDPRPENAVELSEEHRDTVRYYEECRAVGHFPDDPIVRWAARVLKNAADHCDKAEANRTQLTVLSVLRG